MYAYFLIGCSMTAAKVAIFGFLFLVLQYMFRVSRYRPRGPEG